MILPKEASPARIKVDLFSKFVEIVKSLSSAASNSLENLPVGVNSVLFFAFNDIVHDVEAQTLNTIVLRAWIIPIFSVEVNDISTSTHGHDITSHVLISFLFPRIRVNILLSNVIKAIGIDILCEW